MAAQDTGQAFKTQVLMNHIHPAKCLAGGECRHPGECGVELGE